MEETKIKHKDTQSLVSQKEQRNKDAEKGQFLSLFVWLKKYWIIFVISLVISVVLPLTFSLVPQFFNYAFSVILEKKAPDNIKLPRFIIKFFELGDDGKKQLILVGVGIIIFQSIRGIFMYLNSFLRTFINEGMARDMRSQLYTKITLLPLEFYHDNKAGDLIQRCTSDVERITSILSFSISATFFMIISFTMGIYYVSTISAYVLIPILSVGPIILIISLISLSIRKRDYKSYQEAEADVISSIQENVNGTRVVKAFNNEKYDEERFQDKITIHYQKHLKLGKNAVFFWTLIEMILISTFFLTVLTTALLTKSNVRVFSVAEVVMLIMYIGMIINPMQGVWRLIANFSEATVSAGRINKILHSDSEFVIDGTQKPLITGNIKFQNVDFKFQNAEKNLLNNLSFEIKAGETVAILGKTGSGKSTITNLLTRMYEPTNGMIYFDDTKITDIKKSYLRQNVGVILQESFMYNKTVLENVRITNPDASVEEVKNVLKIAHIDKDIEKFKDGVNTLVGEKGTTLSGGQKQRLAIARMLLIKKPIVVFDDSLSAVDLETDHSIRQSLKENNSSQTTIIITHRVTTAREADKIIVVGQNKILEIGTHDELVNKKGFYRLLWQVQGDNEKDLEKVLKGGGYNA